MATQQLQHAGQKRERSVSSAALQELEHHRRPAAEAAAAHPAAAPLLPHTPGESKAAYFARLGELLSTSGARALLSPADDFTSGDGLYIYKRPVRSAGPEAAAMLASGGSVFHHVVVYVKRGERLDALEFGPANAMDITSNMMEAVEAGPVVAPHPPPAPDPACLPMLHVAAPALHALDAPHVRAALAFAQRQRYHALTCNCIAFADFVVRVLTGGAVRSAPLLFDHVVGSVPPADSPMLALLYLTTQLTWFDVVDGGRLMRAYLEAHPGGEALVPLEAGAAAAAAAAAAAGTAGEAAATAEPAAPADSARSEDTAAAALPGAAPVVPPLRRTASSAASSAVPAAAAAPPPAAAAAAARAPLGLPPLAKRGGGAGGASRRPDQQ